MVECTHHGLILALFLKSYNQYLVVGDIMRSMTVLEFKSDNNTLVEIARDFNSVYTRGVDIIDDNNFLGSDENGNIFVMKRNTTSAVSEERSRLEMQSGYHIGDFVNSFCRGTLTSHPQKNIKKSDNDMSTIEPVKSNGIDDNGESAAVIRNVLDGNTSTSFLYGTVSGSIGSIITIDQETFKFMSIVEKSIRQVIKGIGGLLHDEWRNYHHTRRHNFQRNTIDGELVEMFFELNENQMIQVVKLINDAYLDAYDGSSKIPRDPLHGGSTEKKALPMVLTLEEVLLRIEELMQSH